MTTRKKAIRAKIESISAVEVGRYIKRLSSLNKDRYTGNPALSVALEELASFLMNTKEQTVREAISHHQKEIELSPDENPTRDNAILTLSEVAEILGAPEVTRVTLIAVGSERFGIPTSKMTKLSKEDIVKAIRLALEHEQSIEILADEASRGGKSRTS